MCQSKLAQLCNRYESRSLLLVRVGLGAVKDFGKSSPLSLPIPLTRSPALTGTCSHKYTPINAGHEIAQHLVHPPANPGSPPNEETTLLFDTVKGNTHCISLQSPAIC